MISDPVNCIKIINGLIKAAKRSTAEKVNYVANRPPLSIVVSKCPSFPKISRKTWNFISLLQKTSVFKHDYGPKYVEKCPHFLQKTSQIYIFGESIPFAIPPSTLVMWDSYSLNYKPSTLQKIHLGKKYLSRGKIKFFMDTKVDIT